MIFPFMYAPDSVFESKYESFKDEANSNNDATFFKISDSIIEDPNMTLNDVLNISYMSKKKFDKIIKEIFQYKIYVLTVLACILFIFLHY